MEKIDTSRINKIKLDSVNTMIRAARKYPFVKRLIIFGSSVTDCCTEESDIDVCMDVDHVFMNSCTVLNDTLAWDIQGNRDTSACLDIDPDTLYDLPSSKKPFEMEQHST